MSTLYNLFRAGTINLSEYQDFLDLGYDPNDTIQLNTGRGFEVVTVGYMNTESGRTWTLAENETMMAYIGPNKDLTNAGTMTIAGDVMFMSNIGKFVNTGEATITGNLTITDI